MLKRVWQYFPDPGLQFMVDFQSVDPCTL